MEPVGRVSGSEAVLRASSASSRALQAPERLALSGFSIYPALSTLADPTLQPHTPHIIPTNLQCSCPKSGYCWVPLRTLRVYAFFEDRLSG